jgi:hypothetical protein
MHQPFTLTITASAVAWYAAIVSTVGGIIQVMNYLRDRVKIKIAIRRNMAWTGDPFRAGKTFTVVIVTNAGRRPVTITQIGEMHLDGSADVYLDIVPPVPCELTEGKYAMANVDQATIRSVDIRHFYACDATGRYHKLKYASLRRRIIWAARRWYEKLTESS